MSSTKAVIYKPNEHADEYMVFVEDVDEVSSGVSFVAPVVVDSGHQAAVGKGWCWRWRWW